MRDHALSLGGTLLMGWLVVSARAAAYQEPGAERVNDTAYTLNPGELSLGILEAEAGLAREVLIGTYVPTWFAFPVLREPIPTGFLKVRDPFHGPLSVSGRFNFAYIDADVFASRWAENNGSNASIYVFPLELSASYRFSRHFTQSLSVTYVVVRAVGSEQSDDSFRGAAALTNVSVSSFSEWRVSRVVALTLLLRGMVYRGNAHMRGRFTRNGTDVELDVGAEDPYQGIVACAVPGVSFSFSHVNLELGAGYGSFWLPAVQFPVTKPNLVPAANFYVRF